MSTVKTNAADKLRTRIAYLIRLAEDPRTGEGEKDAALRALDRLRAKAKEAGEDVGQRSQTWGRAYQYKYVGEKYNGYMSSTDLAKAIREEIKLFRKKAYGKAADVRPGAVALADPIGDVITAAPKEIKFSVRKEDYSGGRSIYITIKNTPAGWWQDATDHDFPGRAFRVPGPELAALAKALWRLMQAYNYDDSDAQVDHFNVNFYGHVAADNVGGGRTYPRDINCYHL